MLDDENEIENAIDNILNLDAVNDDNTSENIPSRDTSDRTMDTDMPEENTEKADSTEGVLSEDAENDKAEDKFSQINDEITLQEDELSDDEKIILLEKEIQLLREESLLYEYDNFADEHAYDKAPKIEVEPQKQLKLSVLLSIAIPVMILMLVLRFIVLSDSDIAKNYKKNLSENITALMNNIWIKSTPDNGVELIGNSELDYNATNADEETENQKNKVSEYNTDVRSSVIIPFANAVGAADFVQYKSGVVCAGANSISYIKKDGKEQWKRDTTITDPIVKAEGAYIALAERGGKRLCLYDDDELLYDISVNESIRYMEMNNDGDVVIVTDKTAYKGAVAVYNKNGENIFAWSSGKDTITAADISDGSRSVAVALVNTDNAVYTTLSLFNVKKEDSYAKLVCENTLIFEVQYSGSTLCAFGDNSMIGMDTDGDIVYDKRFDNVELSHCAMDTNGNKVMAFEHNNFPTMNIYNKNGSLKYTMTSDTMPQYIDTKSYNVIYNNNRDIILGKPDTKKPYKYTAAMDIRGLVMIDPSSFLIIYSNSIEMVRM